MKKIGEFNYFIHLTFVKNKDYIREKYSKLPDKVYYIIDKDLDTNGGIGYYEHKRDVSYMGPYGPELRSKIEPEYKTCSLKSLLLPNFEADCDSVPYIKNIEKELTSNGEDLEVKAKEYILQLLLKFTLQGAYTLKTIKICTNNCYTESHLEAINVNNTYKGNVLCEADIDKDTNINLDKIMLFFEAINSYTKLFDKKYKYIKTFDKVSVAIQAYKFYIISKYILTKEIGYDKDIEIESSDSWLEGDYVDYETTEAKKNIKQIFKNRKILLDMFNHPAHYANYNYDKIADKILIKLITLGKLDNFDNNFKFRWILNSIMENISKFCDELITKNIQQ